MLTSIYNRLWDLQTAAGVKFKTATPTASEYEIFAHLDSLFEKHRVEAYESIMETSLELKTQA